MKLSSMCGLFIALKFLLVTQLLCVQQDKSILNWLDFYRYKTSLPFNFLLLSPFRLIISWNIVDRIPTLQFTSTPSSSSQFRGLFVRKLSSSSQNSFCSAWSYGWYEEQRNSLTFPLAFFKKVSNLRFDWFRKLSVTPISRLGYFELGLNCIGSSLTALAHAQVGSGPRMIMTPALIRPCAFGWDSIPWWKII